jgi:phospholipid/cholesterol/gamma-HCH transport system substrate-binding protein
LKLTREIKTAILVLSAIILFIWGYSFLKGKDVFSNYKTFYAIYENVEGLDPSSPVTINGLVVGKVTRIEIDRTTGKLKVNMQIKTDFPIAKSSVASIYEPGFISGKQIAIIPNFKDTAVAENGQELKAETQLSLTENAGKKLKPIQIKIERIMENADVLLQSINNVLNDKGQQDLKVTLFELSKTVEEFHKTSVKINDILDKNNANINKSVVNFTVLSDSLKRIDLGKTVRNLNESLAKINVMMTNLEAGKGSAGKLLKDEALYDNIKNTSKELELLLEDVRLNPTRYVNVSLFGKKNKPYVGPKTETVVKDKK